MKNSVLEELKSTDGFVSGEALSQKLGVSRTAVWKSINSLKEQGFIIESVRNKGYRLTSSPDRLNADIIADGLETSTIGKKIVVLPNVDSTNDEVKRRASAGEPEGLVVIAEHQSAGKGRFGRIWSSDSGGVYFTVLVRPELPPSDIASVTLAAGLAVCLAIREYTGLDAKIKWPNDIIIGRKKLCGILTEMSAQSDRIDFIAIGIGINVNHTFFPEEIKSKATSLYLETGERIDRNSFMRCVIKKLDTVLSSFFVSVSLDDEKLFEGLCATIGRSVTVQRNGEELSGIAEGITGSGELIIKSHDKKTVIGSGEVTVQGIY